MLQGFVQIALTLLLVVGLTPILGGYLARVFMAKKTFLDPDILITVGIFSILGLVQGIEADSLFIVALLTIAGFSVQDTVVIYDRVRENLKLNPNQPIDELVDNSVQQTLTRSINTVFAVLLTLFSIYLFGGETLKSFALTLIIGFTMGAYSSIFVASALLAWWRQKIGRVATPNSI